MDATDTSNPQSGGNARKRPADSARQALITLERSQKLDLLIHLLTNLQQPLVLCGPEGIGKTTLLDVLRTKEIPAWHICSIQAAPQLSFERVQQILVESVQEANPDLKHYQLPEIMEHFSSNQEKLVVLLDDAGELVPGMITTLCQFAAANPVLRFVFVLTPDQLHVKSSSDKVIEDCHFIELPPLTEQQCGEFLQNLSSKPGAVVSFNAISSAMVKKLYRDTHGIPGKIMAIFPTLDSYAPGAAQKRLLLSLLAAGVIAAGIGYLLWGQQKPQDSAQNTTVIRAESRKIVISPPVIMADNEETPQEPVATPESSRGFAPAATDPLPAAMKAPQADGNLEQETVASDPKQETVAIQPTDTPVSRPAELRPELNETPAIPSSLEKPALPDQGKPPQVIVPAASEVQPRQKPAGTIPSSEPATETTPAQRGETGPEAAEKQQPATIQNEKPFAPAIPREPLVAAEKTAEPAVPAPEKAASLPVEQEQSGDKQANVTKPAKPVAESRPAVVRKAAASDASQWLLQPPPGNYTLQLMALSKRQAAQQVLQKYSHLPRPLKYVRIVNKGRERFIIVYGSFATTAEAAKAKKTLPAALRNTWLRRFSGLQKRIAGN